MGISPKCWGDHGDFWRLSLWSSLMEQENCHFWEVHYDWAIFHSNEITIPGKPSGNHGHLLGDEKKVAFGSFPNFLSQKMAAHPIMSHWYSWAQGKSSNPVPISSRLTAEWCGSLHSLANLSWSWRMSTFAWWKMVRIPGSWDWTPQV